MTTGDAAAAASCPGDELEDLFGALFDCCSSSLPMLDAEGAGAGVFLRFFGEGGFLTTDAEGAGEDIFLRFFFVEEDFLTTDALIVN